MAVFQSLPLNEQARQLRNPEGDVGIAVAEWLNQTNRQANHEAVELLHLGPRDYVLEIGFGNGRAVPDIVAQAAGVRYASIDISPTMVDEATRFNAALVAGRRFVLVEAAGGGLEIWLGIPGRTRPPCRA